MAQVPFNKAYVDQFLTNMSIAYMNQDTDMIADKIFPSVKVVKDSAKIVNYGKQALRLVETERGIGGKYNSVDYKVESTDMYQLEDHGLTTDVLREDVENADAPVDAEVDKTKMLLQQVKLSHEYKALSVLVPATITNNLQLASASDKFSSYATSDPFKVIQAGVDAVFAKTGKLPNNMAMSYDVYSTLKNHPDVIARFPGATSITEQMVVDTLAALFGRMQLHVSKAKINDTNLGATDVLSDLFSKKIFIYYSEATPTLQSTSFGKKFTRSSDGFQVARYPQSVLGQEAIKRQVWSMILANQKYDMTIVDVDCGYLLYDVIA